MAANISTTLSNWSSTAGSNQPDSTDLASTLREDLQAIQAAVVTVFPGMAGAAWRAQTKAADYALQVTDNMTRITVTAAATISGTAATLGNGFVCIIYNTHTAAITIPGTYTLQPGEAVLLTCNASAFLNLPFTMLGWRQLAASTTAGAASVTLTGLSGSLYNYHKLICRNVTVAADSELYIRLGNGSLDSGNNYLYQYIEVAGTTVSGFTSAGISELYISPSLEATSSSYEFDIDMWVGTSAPRTHIDVCIHGITGAGAYTSRYTTGYWNGTTPDRVLIAANGGNIGGSFTLVGYR